MLLNDQVERINDKVYEILEKWLANAEEEKGKNEKKRMKELHTTYQPGEEKKENQSENNVKKGCRCTSSDVQW